MFLQGITGRLFGIQRGDGRCGSYLSFPRANADADGVDKVRHEKKDIVGFITRQMLSVRLNNGYRSMLDAFLKRRKIAVIIVILALGLIVLLWKTIPAEMAPLEDRSQLSINTTAVEGATYEFMLDYVTDISKLVEKKVPERIGYTMFVMGGSRGNVRIMLKKPDERKRSQQEIADALSIDLRKKTKARPFVIQQSTFGGRRAGQPIQYVLQATTLEKLKEVLPVFMAKVMDNPTFQMADVNLKFTKPEIRIHINRDKATTLGVSTQNIGQTLQLALSGQRFGYFFMNGKQYQILGEMARNDRNKPLDLKSLYVRNNSGKMIQFDNLVSLSEETAPPQLFRYNRFVSATVSAGLAKGKTIGQGLDEMDKIAKEVLDDTFRTALAGDSKDFKESSSSLSFAFALALILIFLVLAAQFESFKDPLVVMMTVPLAITGALIFMWYFDVTMNIFSQIGIIMLIGLVSKNGILIVEFANQRKNSGL
ncbi:MAG: efflux RND transporter permease subunit, partial [Bacteroidales bacterium]